MAWQVAFELAKLIYRFSALFPRGEEFGLRAQIRRAAVSIASNTAEGAGRGTDKEFAQFVTVARASLNEVETQYLLAVDLEFCAKSDDIERMMERLYGLLNGLRNSLR